MAFSIFQTYSTTTATGINDNFLWIGDGNLLPAGSTTLTKNTSTVHNIYDLGSSAYRWNEIHIQNAYLQLGGTDPTTTFANTWNLICRIELPGGISTPANRIEITGLNGDTDELYHIIFKRKMFSATNTYLYNDIYINGDSGANYGYQEIRGSMNSASSMHINSNTYNYFGDITGSSLFNFITYNKTGKTRLWLGNRMNDIAPSVSYWVDIMNYKRVGFFWNNINDTITSLVFISNNNLLTETSIEIWTLK